MARAQFTQVFHPAAKALSDQLTLQERGVLFSLLPHIGRADTVIRSRTGEAMNVTQIAERIGVSRQHATTLLARLVEVGALIEADGGRGKAFAFHSGLAHRFRRKVKVDK